MHVLCALVHCFAYVGALATPATANRPAAIVLLRPRDDPAIVDDLQCALATAKLPLLLLKTDGASSTESIAARAHEADCRCVAIFELSVCAAASVSLLQASEELDADLYRYQSNVAMFRRLRGDVGPSWIAAGTTSASSEEVIAEANGWSYLAGDEEPTVDTSALTNEELCRLLGIRDNPPCDDDDARRTAVGSETPAVGPLGYYVAPDSELLASRPPAWTAQAEAVLRQGATEPPHSYKLADGRPFPHEGALGTFVSPATGAPLFIAEQRRRSTSGWPSFAAAITSSDRSPDCAGTALAAHLERALDYAGGVPRTEVLEAASQCHLGHDFEGTLCINAASLLFVPLGAPTPRWLPEPPAPAIARLLHEAPEWLGQAQVATFAAGCFWKVRSVLAAQLGVLTAVAGFCGGDTAHPTYEEVCAAGSGVDGSSTDGGEHGSVHVEAVQVAFDPQHTSYATLLEAYWSLVPDPTSRYRQGGDVGRQYETAIFYHSDEQRQLATASRDWAQSQRGLATPIVTALRPATRFWHAGDAHQR